MANKYNLSHDTQYKVLSSNYLSLENGGGTSCDNCNKIITTTVVVEDTEGNTFVVGADCAMTLAGIGKIYEAIVKETVKRCKKFYKEVKNYNILEKKDCYILFEVVKTRFDKRPITPFINVPFISISKENLSDKFKNKIRTIEDIVADCPELENNYYIKQWKDDNRN